MRDYHVYDKTQLGTINYYDEYNNLHRLNGAAIEWYDGSKSFFIKNINYASLLHSCNKFYIYYAIIDLLPQYEIYIKQNIKDLTSKYNPQIKLRLLKKEEINELPNWLKDFIIL